MSRDGNEGGELIFGHLADGLSQIADGKCSSRIAYLSGKVSIGFSDK